MASFHPGVKALLERIAKQQPVDSQLNKENLKDAKMVCDKSGKSSQLTLFKDNLKQRMKEKRLKLRKEEEEEDQEDEEYHFSAKITQQDRDSESKEDSDDQEDEEKSLSSQEDESEEDLKLKFDNEDEDEEAELTDFKAPNAKKPTNFLLQTQMSQIPASIPSNQLTSNSSITIIRSNNNNNNSNVDDETNDNFSETQPKFRLFMETEDENPNNKTKLDELESLSFTCGDNTANSSTLDQSKNVALSDEVIAQPVDDENGEELFDELAFLCSGKFKDPTQAKDNNDAVLESISCEPQIKQVSKPSHLDDIFTAADDSDDERVPEMIDEIDGDASNDVVKNSDDEDSGDGVRKKSKTMSDFFEAEAELSGEDEGEGDENDEGSDVDELVCSGDEDDLPSDSEIKDRLNQIYLKDQMDQEKKKLRFLKEMYLKDGELHQDKGHRKKNFRWKNLDDNTIGNPFSDNDSENENSSDEDDNGVEKKEQEINIQKSKKFNGDWRSNRHEREAFHEKEKKKWHSDDERDDDSRQNFLDENSCSSSSSNFVFKTSQNQFLKIGQSLLQLNSKKRKIDDTLEQQQEKMKSSLKSNTETASEKCSILKKNKTYLSRLSSYINKTIVKQQGGGKASSNTQNKNALIFASVTHEEARIVEENVDRSVRTNEPNEEPKVKKQKINAQNTADSIFNLL